MEPVSGTFINWLPITFDTGTIQWSEIRHSNKNLESVLTKTKIFQQDLKKVAANRDQNKPL